MSFYLFLQVPRMLNELNTVTLCRGQNQGERSSTLDFKFGCFIQRDFIITFLKRWLRFIKIQSSACQDLRTVYYFNSCAMRRKNMFCFDLFGEEIGRLASFQGGKFPLVPTPSKLHPASPRLGAGRGSWQINRRLARQPPCFSELSGHAAICRRAVGKTGKDFREEEQRRNVTFCQSANKWKLIHPVQWVFVSALG